MKFVWVIVNVIYKDVETVFDSEEKARKWWEAHNQSQVYKIEKKVLR